ncbi:hypothetical protein [Nocardia sp. CA-119907]|uniref:hypothetical protein n=1 Tax=Nocardia sp. CA-119907 TaxID=3239973 RepID=UPI003D99D28B
MSALTGLVIGIAAFSRGDTTAGIVASLFAILVGGAGTGAVIGWARADFPDTEGFVPALSSLVLAPVLVGIGSLVTGHWVVGLAAVALGATMIPLGAALIRGQVLAFGVGGVAAIGIGIWVLVGGTLLGGAALIGIGGTVVFVGGVIGFVRGRRW